MAFIVEQFVGDRGIQLGIENVVRPFQFGTNWSKIRVGVRWSMNGYSTFPQNTMPIIGICTGSAGPLSNNCIDSLYTSPFFRNNAILYAGTAPNNYLYTTGSAQISFLQSVAGSGSVAGSFSATSPSIAANPSALRSGFFFDIQKAATNTMTVSAVYPTNSQVVNDLSRGNYLAAMEAESATYATWLTISGVVTSALPTRTVKDWDSMTVGWVRTTPALCVYDMTVVRFY